MLFGTPRHDRYKCSCREILLSHLRDLRTNSLTIYTNYESLYRSPLKYFKCRLEKIREWYMLDMDDDGNITMPDGNYPALHAALGYLRDKSSTDLFCLILLNHLSPTDDKLRGIHYNGSVSFLKRNYTDTELYQAIQQVKVAGHLDFLTTESHLPGFFAAMLTPPELLAQDHRQGSHIVVFKNIRISWFSLRVLKGNLDKELAQSPQEGLWY